MIGQKKGGQVNPARWTTPIPLPPNFSMMRKWEIVRPESGEESGIAPDFILRPYVSQRAATRRPKRHCSRFVVAFGSELFKSRTEQSMPPRCECLRNRVESKIFRTCQKSPLFYESAALTAELRAHISYSIPRRKNLANISWSTARMLAPLWCASKDASRNCKLPRKLSAPL